MLGMILVPLDGSDAAERALPIARSLAEKYSAQLVLIRAVMPERLAAVSSLTSSHFKTYEQEIQKDQAVADRYLEHVAQRLSGQGLTVRTRAVVGSAAGVICSIAQSDPIDLIVMSTHGRTGARRLIYGSVVDAVLRAAHVPVMLVPAR
ncbi:MAG TPA: universal stress protein [Anaerolineales bacterium]|nr:universal stress protein [Anaerolineales bacterium]